MSASQVLGSTEQICKTTNLSSITDEIDGSASFPDAPEWLTRIYLENVLKLHYKDNNLRITQMDVSPALSKGENYGGVLTRIMVEFKTGNQGSLTGHYIVKSSFENDEFAKKKMEPYDLFNREMTIYEQVLPKLNNLLREINDPEEIFAETLAVDYQRSALIFEDLKVRGYTMPDRLKGLNMQLSKIVLKKLAKMHATSAVLNAREAHCLQGYDRGMFNRHTDSYAPCYLGLLDACSQLLSTWEEYKHYGKKLEKMRPMYMELAKRVFDVNEDHLNVFAHGDLWTNNVMVKYNEKTQEPLDVIIIDFQYAAWGSPAIDLFYLLNTSVEDDIHMNRQNELIQYYYLFLADTLQKLSFTGGLPSLHNFHLQLHEKSFYAFHSTCFVRAIQRAEETEDADFNALMGEDERALNFKKSVYKNPKLQKVLRTMVPVYNLKGLLDFDQ